ncbi:MULTISPECIES: DUF805 domain-containing protein [Megasphaera]|nr:MULTISPECIES: DUF805 domain-containing protein [Megasphaera]EGS32643.1 hypothetical protein HMPREF1040_1068 [Megasphaera sp. UPII 135-E]
MYMNETEKITYDSPFEVGFAGSKDAYHQNPPCYGYNPRTYYEPWRDDSLTDRFFSPRGRMSRKAFAASSIIGWIVMIIWGSILMNRLWDSFLHGMTGLMLPTGRTFFTVSYCEITLLFAIFIGFCVMQSMFVIRRLHDRNKSGWHCIIMYLPYIGILFWVYLLFAKGTKGNNKYGPDPLTHLG